MSKRLLLLALCASLAAPAGAATLDYLGRIVETGKTPGAAATLTGAKVQSGKGFDEEVDRSGAHTGFSPPLVAIPASGAKKHPQANLIVGEPGKHQLREPKSPLTKDGKAKEQKSGKWLWWTLGGAAAGAGIGFFLGGPIGAAIDAVVGGLLGFFFGP